MDDHNAAAQSGTAITAGYTSWGGGSWSADGAHVYLHTSADIPVDEEGRAAMGADGQTHPDRLNRNRIFRVATDGSGEITLVADMQDFSVANPQVSPDGTHIAFTSSDQRDLGYAQTENPRHAHRWKQCPGAVRQHRPLGGQPAVVGRQPAGLFHGQQ